MNAYFLGKSITFFKKNSHWLYGDVCFKQQQISQ